MPTDKLNFTVIVNAEKEQRSDYARRVLVSKQETLVVANLCVRLADCHGLLEPRCCIQKQVSYTHIALYTVLYSVQHSSEEITQISFTKLRQIKLRKSRLS